MDRQAWRIISTGCCSRERFTFPARRDMYIHYVHVVLETAAAHLPECTRAVRAGPSAADALVWSSTHRREKGRAVVWMSAGGAAALSGGGAVPGRERAATGREREALPEKPVLVRPAAGALDPLAARACFSSQPAASARRTTSRLARAYICLPVSLHRLLLPSFYSPPPHPFQEAITPGRQY